MTRYFTDCRLPCSSLFQQRQHRRCYHSSTIFLAVHNWPRSALFQIFFDASSAACVLSSHVLFEQSSTRRWPSLPWICSMLQRLSIFVCLFPKRTAFQAQVRIKRAGFNARHQPPGWNRFTGFEVFQRRQALIMIFSHCSWNLVVCMLSLRYRKRRNGRECRILFYHHNCSSNFFVKKCQVRQNVALKNPFVG